MGKFKQVAAGDKTVDMTPEKSANSSNADKAKPREVPEAIKLAEEAATPSTPSHTDETIDKGVLPSSEPENKKQFVLDDWVKEAPQEELNKYQQSLYDEWYKVSSEQVNKQLHDAWGDLFPVLEVLNDPKNKEVRKKVAKLSDKDFLEFVTETAYQIHYGDGTEDNQPQAKLPQDVQDRLDKYDSFIAQQETDKKAAQQKDFEADYVKGRNDEIVALASEFPELRWKSQGDEAWKLLEYIRDMAEDKTRATNKKVSYLDIYNEHRKYSGKTPPLNISDSSNKTIVSESPTREQNPNVPNSALDRRTRFLSEIEKSGGFHKYAQKVSAK